MQFTQHPDNRDAQGLSASIADFGRALDLAYQISPKKFTSMRVDQNDTAETIARKLRQFADAIEAQRRPNA